MTKKIVSLILAAAMALSLCACGSKSATTAAPKAEEQTAAAPAKEEAAPAAEAAPAEEAAPAAEAAPAEEAAPASNVDAADVAAKWTEEETDDGWMKVTNEGGKTLGYSKDSGVSIIQVDGLAFKDLNRNGSLDAYEDWRLDSSVRAEDLASQMTGEEIAPMLTHGGWMSFGYTIEEGSEDYNYILAGGRGGVTRSAGSQGNTTMAVAWSNALQALCEANGGFGIPATVSIDPNDISGMIDQLGLGATMNTDLAFKIGQEMSRQYRAVGISMLLGPQIDLVTNPTFDRSTGTYGEDPALTRDITAAFVNGLQSTFDENGEDLGWGTDSVIAVMKHFAGAGSAEGGRNDHNEEGRYTIYPGKAFETSVIAFADGAFNLSGKTERAAGLMPNYAVSYDKNKKLGEWVAGAYSEYKLGLARAMGFDGIVVSDWGIVEDGDKTWGMEDYTVAERHAALYKNGVDQIGGSSNVEAPVEAYYLLCDELGDDEADALMRERAKHIFVSQMNCGLFDNPYVETALAEEICWSAESMEFGLETQLMSVVMLKNSGNVIAPAGEEKKTVYIPMVFTAAEEGNSSAAATPASWAAALDLELAAEYFNVITDTVGEPSGKDADGNAVYTENDVVRASAEDLASCDMVLVPMTTPHTSSTKTEDGKWLPASIQYEKYTAKTARTESVAGTVTTEIINDGYSTKSQDVKENRSYYNNTAAQASNYSDLELLQYCASAVPETCKVVVLMNATGAMVWGETEPLADAILEYYGGESFNGAWFSKETLMKVVAGQYEPSGLLTIQQPKDMKAVEKQKEDLPRDCECYVDADGNTYDFAFGMNWSGVINDERVATYSAEPLSKCANFEFYYAK